MQRRTCARSSRASCWSLSPISQIRSSRSSCRGSRAQREGYAVLVGDTQHNEKREERYALILKRKEADGLIFLGHRLSKEAARVVKSMAPKPAPIVNGCEFSPRLGVPSVHIDNAKAA